MEGIVAVLIPIVVIIMIAFMTKWLSDNRVRRELTNANASPEMIEKLMAKPVQDVESNLKWGIVALAVGLALCGIDFFHLDAGDPLAFGIVFISGGAALLVYYGLASRRN